MEFQVNIIANLYKNHHDYTYQDINQISIMIQCAKQAQDEGYDDDVVLAALFHNIGYLIKMQRDKTLGTIGFENISADYIEKCGFNKRIVDIIRNQSKNIVDIDNKVFKESIILYKCKEMIKKCSVTYEINFYKPLILKSLEFNHN